MDITGLNISQIKEKIAIYSYKDYPKIISILLNDSRKGVQDLSIRMQKSYNDQKIELERIRKLKTFQQKLVGQDIQTIAGIDEVGRGPLAGPVVSCAVMLPVDSNILYINDSKQLTPLKREELCDKIKKEAISLGIGIIPSTVIDEVNIYQSTKQSMVQAVEQLNIRPDVLVIDAMKLESLSIPQISVIKGDERCYSIAAASIVAKVTRDTMMEAYHQEYPQYHFLSNKGYGTREHIEAIKKYGICPIHRLSFLNKLAEYIEQPGY
ncbi:MAG: ribonuclease HII [Eubacteriales bacterium]